MKKKGQTTLQGRIFETLYNSKKQLIFAFNNSTGEISDIEDQLNSRFRKALYINLKLPTVDTLFRILMNKLKSKNIARTNEIQETVRKLFIQGWNSKGIEDVLDISKEEVDFLVSLNTNVRRKK